MGVPWRSARADPVREGTVRARCQGTLVLYHKKDRFTLERESPPKIEGQESLAVPRIFVCKVHTFLRKYR